MSSQKSFKFKYSQAPKKPKFEIYEYENEDDELEEPVAYGKF